MYKVIHLPKGVFKISAKMLSVRYLNPGNIVDKYVLCEDFNADKHSICKDTGTEQLQVNLILLWAAVELTMGYSTIFRNPVKAIPNTKLQ